MTFDLLADGAARDSRFIERSQRLRKDLAPALRQTDAAAPIYGAIGRHQKPCADNAIAGTWRQKRPFPLSCRFFSLMHKNATIRKVHSCYFGCGRVRVLVNELELQAPEVNNHSINTASDTIERSSF